MRVCNKCGHEKELTKSYNKCRLSKRNLGYVYTCKDCLNQKAKLYYQQNCETIKSKQRDKNKTATHKQIRASYRIKNKEKIAYTSKLYKEKNKERLKEQAKGKYQKNLIQERSKHLLRTYGIDHKEYERLSKQQNNSCGICEKPPEKGKFLHVDRCHETNRVRGLLCNKCNLAVGLFSDNTILLKNAIYYLDDKH